jgi:hypothetical protein
MEIKIKISTVNVQDLITLFIVIVMIAKHM